MSILKRELFEMFADESAWALPQKTICGQIERRLNDSSLDLEAAKLGSGRSKQDSRSRNSKLTLALTHTYVPSDL